MQQQKSLKGLFLALVLLFVGLGWGQQSEAHPLRVAPLPLWTAESNEIEANLNQVAFGDFNGDGYADLVALAPDASHPEVAEGLILAWYGGSGGLGAAGTVANAAWTAETDQAGAHLSSVTTGDLNGDGYDEVIAAWQAEANVAVGLFGTALTTGDFNGDGYADLAIGASSMSNGQTSEGRVFVYLGSSSGLGVNGTPANAAWRSESNQASASWGSALTSGDFNGDGYADLAIGAARYDNGQTDEGAVFVYFGASSGLGTNGTPANADWSAQSDQIGANLGNALTAGLLFNGDGYADLAVAASAYDEVLVDTPDEGAVFVFPGSSTGLGANGTPGNALWDAQSHQESAYLGTALAVGDMNGDGSADLMVGARWYDAPFNNEGAAFGWFNTGQDLGANGTPGNADWEAYAEQADAWFGNAVAIGDVLGPGGTNVLAVGAPNYTNGEANEGMLWLFPSAPTGCPLATDEDCEATPTPEPTLPPAPTATPPAPTPLYPLYLPLILHP